MTPSRPRVLVVDDSAFARRVVRQIVQAEPRLELAGIARDGLEALESVAELHPDVVTLDLIMPHLDGVGFLRALPPEGAPRVVLVSTSGENSELVADALALGAVDFVHKPTAHATERLYEMRDELVRKILLAAGARAAPASAAARVRPAGEPRAAPPTARGAQRAVDLIVVGTSTGGPQALMRLLATLPANLGVPVAIALHIPAEYTGHLANRLDAASPLSVREAVDGGPLRAGDVVLAPGGVNLRVERELDGLETRIEPAGRRLYVPSVDVLFESAAQATGGRVIGVVLTGMGDDGVIGARSIRDAGGTVLTEAASSCVVYGMPRSVVDAGLSQGEAPVDAIGELVLQRL